MNKGIKLLFAFAIFAFVFSSCNEAAENPVENEAKTVATDTGDKSARKGDVVNKDEKRKTEAESITSSLPKTSMDFVEMEHHFGTIDEGDSVEHIFKFTNSGDEDLIIEKCKGSCGCTVPQCPKEPIPPGATAEIRVKFNSKGKKNHQEKRVTITANTDPLQTVLKIIADVTPAEEEETTPTK